MRASCMRAIHIISFVGLVMLMISYKAISSSSFTLREIPSLTAWFVGCAGFVVVARWWYRARLRAVAGFRAAIENGTTVYDTAMTDFKLYFIPVGCALHIEIEDTTESAKRISLGFWTRSFADRLHHHLRNNPRATAPPAIIEVALPTRARGAKLPKAVAVPRADPEAKAMRGGIDVD